MRHLKDITYLVLGVAGFAAFLLLVTLWTMGLAWVFDHVTPYLILLSGIALTICIFVFLPLSLFRATQTASVYGFFISSAVFGLTTWAAGFLITLTYWGLGAVVVGLCLGIVGIVPLGMLAAAFHTDWESVGVLAFGSIATVGARIIALFLATKIDQAQPARVGKEAINGQRAATSRNLAFTMAILFVIGGAGVFLINKPAPSAHSTGDQSNGPTAAPPPWIVNPSPATSVPLQKQGVALEQRNGQFNGRWSATVGPQGYCKFTSVLVLDVVGSSIVGNATNPFGVFPLTGYVGPDGRGTFKIGKFVGTIRFSSNSFEANYANDCGGRFAMGTRRTTGNLN